jgi:hypothetical protein
LPAWYLPDGTTYAAENQLEDASSSCELWGIWCGVLVVGSVFAEFVIAGVHPPYDSFLEQWGSASADAAIALGIVGEVMFGMWNNRIQTELRKRSNDKLGAAEKAASEANERAAQLGKEAAEARLEFERLRSQLAPRRLTTEQFNKIVESLQGRKLYAVIAFVDSDPETYVYAADICSALIASGCLAEERSGRFTSPVFGLHLLPRPGDPSAADALEAALNNAGIKVARHDIARDEMEPQLQLTVGSKPPPQLVPRQTLRHVQVTAPRNSNTVRE